jgi:hypothetical protein
VSVILSQVDGGLKNWNALLSLYGSGYHGHEDSSVHQVLPSSIFHPFVV